MLSKSKRCLPAQALLLAVALALTAPSAFAQVKKSVLVAEPVHNVGYLPFYVAIRQGFFAEDGLDVKVVTIETGSGHTNAVLSGQALAFLGGPEHNAFAKLKGAELRAVVNCQNRGNTFLMARKGMGVQPGRSLASYIKGKNIAIGPYGSTPHSIMRYLLKRWNLEPNKDVVLQEMAYSAVVAAVKAGKAEIGMATEPAITRGIVEGIWEGPVVNVPKELGPYAYTALNVRLDSIKSDPATVRNFVRGVMRGLKFTRERPDDAVKIAKMEFPTMAESDLKATFDRIVDNEVWSKDGFISPEAWKTGEGVVLEAGVLKKPVPYDDVIDMQFVNALMPTIK